MTRKLLIIVFLCLVAQAHASNYSTYLLSTLSPGPNLYWQLNETSGTTLSNSGSAGSAYNLTTHNTPTLNVSGANGAHGTAVTFTGASSQYANVNKNDTGSGPGDLATDKTFVCWVNGNNGGNVLTTQTSEVAADTSQKWRIAVTATFTTTWTIYDNAGAQYQALNGTTTISAGTWYMVGVTWASGTTTSTIYLNGASEGSTSTTAGTINGAVQFWEIGRLVRASTVYMTGTVQDCSAWASNALSGATMLAIYNHGIVVAGGNGGAVGWYSAKKSDDPLGLPRYPQPDLFTRMVRDVAYEVGGSPVGNPYIAGRIRRPITFGPQLPMRTYLNP